MVKFLYLPSKVFVHPFLLAMSYTIACHFFTSGLSANHKSTVYCASSMLASQSFMNPCTVFPYAMEKFMIFALFLSFAYLSFSSGAGGSPLLESHSSNSDPFFSSCWMCGYMPAAVLEWKSPPSLKASIMDWQFVMCARIRSSSYP